MNSLFAHPWMLWLLPGLVALGVLCRWAAARQRVALALLGGRLRDARRAPLGLLLAGLTLLLLGAAGPRWGRDWTQSAAPGRDVLVVLDGSWSMFAESPSRMHRARAALLDLATHLRTRGGTRVALIAFAGNPRVLCPLTHDLDHFREVVESLDDLAPPPGLGAGTRIGAALSAALELPGSRPERDILLLSDGDDPASDGEWRIIGIRAARDAGVPVHVIALGDSTREYLIRTPSGWLTHQDKEVRTRLKAAPLQRIASETQGEWLPAGTRTPDLPAFYERIARKATADSPDALPVYHPRQTWFLLPAFVFLLVALWRMT
jgi:Ca-activated chloride channel family protein